LEALHYLVSVFHLLQFSSPFSHRVMTKVCVMEDEPFPKSWTSKTRSKDIVKNEGKWKKE